MPNPTYVTNYTGAEISGAIAKILANNAATRMIYAIDMSAATWTTSLDSLYAYQTSITLNGTYAVGEYPTLFAIDGNGNKYDLDYKFTNSNTVIVYVNKTSLVSYIVEVSSTQNL